jgi:hypothetical protein
MGVPILFQRKFAHSILFNISNLMNKNLHFNLPTENIFKMKPLQGSIWAKEWDKLAIGIHIYNPSTQLAEAGGLLEPRSLKPSWAT